MKGRGERQNKEKPRKQRKATRKPQGNNERWRAVEGSEEMGTRRNHGTNHDERQGPLKGGEGEESWAQGATTAQAMMNATGLFRKEGMCSESKCFPVQLERQVEEQVSLDYLTKKKKCVYAKFGTRI